MATTDEQHIQTELHGNISGNQKCHPHDDDVNAHHDQLSHGKQAASCHLYHDLDHVSSKDEICNDADHVQDSHRGSIIHVDHPDPHDHHHVGQEEFELLHISHNHEEFDTEERRRVVETHYGSHHNILVVGDDDFSFAASLATSLGSASNVTVTSPHSRGEEEYQEDHNYDVQESVAVDSVEDKCSDHLDSDGHGAGEEFVFDDLAIKDLEISDNKGMEDDDANVHHDEVCHGKQAASCHLNDLGHVPYKHEVCNDADHVEDSLRSIIIIHADPPDSHDHVDKEEFADLHISSHEEFETDRSFYTECHQDAVCNVTKDMVADNGEIHVTRNCGLDCKDVQSCVDATELVHDDGGFAGERRDECVHDQEDHKHDVSIEKDEGGSSISSSAAGKDDQLSDENDVQESVATGAIEDDGNTVVLDEERRITHYNNHQKILLVGEGDFSFASCLATAFLSASNLTATSLDSRGTVVSKYSKGEQNLRNLEERGAVVIHQVDAGTMNAHPRLRSKLFDRVVFNFPHAGETYSAVKESDSWYIELHQRVVRRFFTAARKMLTERGQVHVTHKSGYPFQTWEIIQLAENVGLVLVRCEPWRNAYAGYENKKAYGSSWDSTFPVRGAYNYMFCTSKS